MSDASFKNLLICIDLRGTNWHLKAKTMKIKKKKNGWKIPQLKIPVPRKPATVT